jgi:hypothetical protein
MGKFLFNNLDYVVSIGGVLIVGTVMVLKLKRPAAKNYGDVTQLVIRHKKMQQAITPGKKLF